MICNEDMADRCRIYGKPFNFGCGVNGFLQNYLVVFRPSGVDVKQLHAFSCTDERNASSLGNGVAAIEVVYANAIALPSKPLSLL